MLNKLLRWISGWGVLFQLKYNFGSSPIQLREKDSALQIWTHDLQIMDIAFHVLDTFVLSNEQSGALTKCTATLA